MSKKENKFFELALESDALLLGDFTLKSGKKSPYFFNIASIFSNGQIHALADLYSDLVLESNIIFDVIFGPAYKGIPLAAAVSASLTEKTSKFIPFAFDRKEVKDHGEGGMIVGEVQNKSVLIIDDVLTAGTALKQSLQIINEAGGKANASIIALDREEKIDGIVARDAIKEEFDIQLESIAKISKLTEYLESVKRNIEADIIKQYLKDN